MLLLTGVEQMRGPRSRQMEVMLEARFEQKDIAEEHLGGGKINEKAARNGRGPSNAALTMD